MKIPIPFLFFFLLTLTTRAQQTNYADIPVTTHSAQALQHYQQGIQEWNNVQVYESLNNFKKALELDPDFFMANYTMALLNLYRPDRNPFLSYADKAILCKDSLNESEKLLKQALVQLKKDPKADVTQYGGKLVQLNPRSFLALSHLAVFQLNIKYYQSVDNTYQAILCLPQDPALVFDAMGKNYMKMNQMDRAKQAFDQYLKAQPDNANAYHSPGNYYVQMEEPQSAYDHYLKAYQWDNIQYKLPI